VKGLFDSKERALAGERDKAIERARAAEGSLREALDKAEAERKALTKRVNELRTECEVRATVLVRLSSDDFNLSFFFGRTLAIKRAME
jgi:predicted  nucleic acid-binding Zn-ribbon protein